MRAQTYLEMARYEFSAPFLLHHPAQPFLMSSFYMQPFNMGALSNPLGEVCSTHALSQNISGTDEEYNRWEEAEKKIIFKYWMPSEFENDFVNVNNNCIYFLNDYYMIRKDRNDPETGVRFPPPQTIDDFISDNRAGVELYWKEEIVRKYFK